MVTISDIEALLKKKIPVLKYRALLNEYPAMTEKELYAIRLIQWYDMAPAEVLSRIEGINNCSTCRDIDILILGRRKANEHAPKHNKSIGKSAGRSRKKVRNRKKMKGDKKRGNSNSKSG